MKDVKDIIINHQRKKEAIETASIKIERISHREGEETRNHKEKGIQNNCQKDTLHEDKVYNNFHQRVLFPSKKEEIESTDCEMKGYQE